MGGAHHRDGRAATEADEVRQIDVVSQAGLLRDMAGHTGAEVAGAGADKQRVHIRRDMAGFLQGLAQGGARERRCLALEAAVEFLRVVLEGLVDGVQREVPALDAGGAIGEDFLQQRGGPRAEGVQKPPANIAVQQDSWVNEFGGTAVARERRYMSGKIF